MYITNSVNTDLVTNYNTHTRAHTYIYHIDAYTQRSQASTYIKYIYIIHLYISIQQEVVVLFHKV